MDEASSPRGPLKLPLFWSDKKQRNTSLEKKESTISRNVWQGENSLLRFHVSHSSSGRAWKPLASVDMIFPAPGRCCRKQWTLALSKKPWGVSPRPMISKGGPIISHVPSPTPLPSSSQLSRALMPPLQTNGNKFLLVPTCASWFGGLQKELIARGLQLRCL